MNYIVLDLEFNQLKFGEPPEKSNIDFPMEILQFGAVKLDASLAEVSRFDSLVKPSVYKELNQKVRQMTGIREEDLIPADPYTVVIERFKEWIGEENYTLCSWGTSDIHELQRNGSFYGLDIAWVANCLDVSKIFMEQTRAVGFGRLHQAIDYFSIDKTLDFHTALNDAVYTSMILSRLSHVDDYIAPAPTYMSRSRIMRILSQQEQQFISACPVCGKGAQAESAWLQSVRKKRSTRVYHCSGCEKTFRVILYINKTISKVIPDKELERIREQEAAAIK